MPRASWFPISGGPPTPSSSARPGSSGTRPPRRRPRARLRLGPFRLRAPGSDDIDEDLAALRESKAAPIGLLDDGSGWPEGISRKENLADLCRRRRGARRSAPLPRVIADAGEDACLGCAHVCPEFSGSPRTTVVRRSAADQVVAAEPPEGLSDESASGDSGAPASATGSGTISTPASSTAATSTETESIWRPEPTTSPVTGAQSA